MSNRCIGIVGLGYVGLPVAVAFGKIFRTIGFDISPHRIKELRDGIDSTFEVETEELKSSKLLSFSSSPADLANADFIVICVPTPVDNANKPDFTPLKLASEMVGSVIKKGAIVVYESTVYPGATEEICVPILEAKSGMKWKEGFHVGYSPERINPGDKLHKLHTIKKVVSGDSPDTLSQVSSTYSRIIDAGVYEAESIKVAEAAKIIENTQRDLNIALINECAMIFNRMGIDTQSVLDAAATKWNFLGFRPGLVGGHCIGVDPYYLTHKAEMLGHHARVILAGRAINDGMGAYIAGQTVKSMLKNGQQVRGAKVLIMGLTFKEDVPDLRNSKVVDVINELKEFGIECVVHDPIANHEDAMEEYNVSIVSDWVKVPECSAAVLAVGHKNFVDMGVGVIAKKIVKGGCLIDIKSVFNRESVKEFGLKVWRL